MPAATSTIAASLKNVPPFPPVAVKLLTLLSNPAPDTNEVADLIASDATFTARLLQRANSAQFRFAASVADVGQAVMLLGLDVTRQVTLAHATSVYSGGLKTEDMLRSWRHTVATAVLADQIAQACDAFAGIAFTAGIMHDIGRLGLIVAYPKVYEEVLHNAAEQSIDVLGFEEENFGVHHAEAGRMLAEQWGLPAEMQLIAGRHHDPSEGAELTLLQIVHVACRLADGLGYYFVKPLRELRFEEIVSELPAQGRESFHLDAEHLSELIEKRIQEFGAAPTENAVEDASREIPPNAIPEPDSTESITAPVDASKDDASKEAAPRRNLVWVGVGIGAIILVAVIYFLTR